MQPRVWIVNQYAISPRDSGGTRHFMLAKSLATHGFAPTILASAEYYQTGKIRPLPQGVTAHPETIDGVDYLWLASIPHRKSSRGRLASMLRFAWHIVSGKPCRALGRPDIIIGSSPPLFAAAAACFVARCYRVPFVLEVRDLWPESITTLMGTSHYHPFILLLRALEKWLYRRADHIITLLPNSPDYFAAHGVPSSRISILPNGIDVTQPMPPASQEEAKQFTLLYLGAIGIPNRVDLLLDAAAILQNSLDPVAATLRFRLVGDGVQRAALEQRAKAENLRNIEFLTPVPKQEIATVLATAHACVIHIPDSPLYRWGTSPNKLFDYLLSGRPTILAGTLAEDLVMRSGGGISIAPENPAALADAALTLARMTAEERALIGEKARAYVLEHHDMNRVGSSLNEILRRLLGNR